MAAITFIVVVFTVTAFLMAIIPRGSCQAIVTSAYNPRWPNATIPYAFHKGQFNSTQKIMMKQAMQEWMKFTCIKFTPADWKKMKAGLHIYGTPNRCSSFVGMDNKKQPQHELLGEGCFIPHKLRHEMGHLIGLYHQHARTDRDKHVTIMTKRVRKDKRRNFDIPTTQSSLGVPYSYRSIMHYANYAFLRKNIKGNATIVTKDPTYQNVIGQLPNIDFSDAHIVNLMYNCSGNKACNEGISIQTLTPPCSAFPFTRYKCMKSANVVNECVEEDCDNCIKSENVSYNAGSNALDARSHEGETNNDKVIGPPCITIKDADFEEFERTNAQGYEDNEADSQQSDEDNEIFTDESDDEGEDDNEDDCESDDEANDSNNEDTPEWLRVNDKQNSSTNEAYLNSNIFWNL